MEATVERYTADFFILIESKPKSESWDTCKSYFNKTAFSIDLSCTNI